mgnify:CR=1 FL=1
MLTKHIVSRTERAIILKLSFVLCSLSLTHSVYSILCAFCFHSAKSVVICLASTHLSFQELKSMPDRRLPKQAWNIRYEE